MTARSGCGSADLEHLIWERSRMRDLEESPVQPLSDLVVARCVQ